MFQRPSPAIANVRSAPELADRLAGVGPRRSLLVRLLGLRACRTWEQKLSFHVARSTRLLRKNDLVAAETELKAAVSAAERCAPRADAPSLRSILTEVHRSLLRPLYDMALKAAGAAQGTEETKLQLKRARAIAEELGDPDEVRWIDEMLEGPRLQPPSSRPRGPFLSGSREGSGAATPAKETIRPTTRNQEDQRAQFRRVARDSRAYASKRIRPRR